MIKLLEIATHSKIDIIDITSQIETSVRKMLEEERGGKSDEGALHIFVPHTTAGITINENADPNVREDMIMQLEKLVPKHGHYKHAEGNSPAHIKSSMMGHGLTLFIKDGKIILGSWQGILFCEFDGPRHRNVYLRISQ